MPATLSLAVLNTLPIYAGRYRTFQLNTSGGSNWSSGSPITLTGGIGASIISGSQQFNNGGNTVTLCVDTGTTGGVLALTDTVNNVSTDLTVITQYVAPIFSGTNYYVQGGIAQPTPPIVVVNGSSGSTVWFYQVRANNSAGSTQTFNINSLTSYNPPGTFNIGSGITCLTTSNATLSASNYNQLYWAPIPGANSYDLMRSADGSTWFKQWSTTNTYFNDQSNSNGSADGGTVANGTALGNDSNDGLTSGTAWATMAHAAASVSANLGNIINATGWITDSAQVVFPSGVKIVGVGKTSTILYSTFSSSTTNASYVPPSAGYISDFTMTCPPILGTALTRILGNGTGDTPTNGCEMWRVRVIGAQSSVYFAQTNGSNVVNPINAQIDAYDCEFLGTHGSCGGTYMGANAGTNMTLNLTRTSCGAFGNGCYAIVTAQGINAYGNICLRDCDIIATADTLSIPTLDCVGIRWNPTYPATVKIINGRVRGANQDFSGSNICTLYLDGNVAYDFNKPLISGPQSGGSVVGSPIVSIVTNSGIYRTDPLIVPPANKVSVGYSYIDPSGTTSGMASYSGIGFSSIPGYNPPFPAATDLRSGVVVGTTTGALIVPPNTNVLFNYFFGPDGNGNQFGLLVPEAGDVATTYSVGSQINSSAGQTCSLAFVPDGVLGSNTIITVSSSPSSGVSGGPFTIPAGDPFVIGPMKFPLSRSYILTFTNNQGLTDPAPLTITIGAAYGSGGVESQLPI